MPPIRKMASAFSGLDATGARWVAAARARGTACSDSRPGRHVRSSSKSSVTLRPCTYTGSFYTKYQAEG